MSFNPANYPIDPAFNGEQYVLYAAETATPDEVVDFTTATNIFQFFAGTSGITPDVNKAPYDYFSAQTVVKSNTSTIINGDQTTTATVNSAPYFLAKMFNNYETDDLINGMISMSALEPFKIDITRTSLQATSLKFTIKTPTPTEITVPITTGMTVSQAVAAINLAAPKINNAPTLFCDIAIGDGTAVFNVLPDTETEIIYNTRFAMLETHVLTVAEKKLYPKKITITTPKINNTTFWNILLYNKSTPEISWQFIGINAKSINFNFANNGITEMTMNLLGKTYVQTNLLTIATPAFIDDYSKFYTQATGNTIVFWDGQFSGSIKDMQINHEFAKEIVLNITGLNIPYSNGRYKMGWSGSSVLNTLSYKQFFIDMLNNRRPVVYLQSSQSIEGVEYKMWVISNFLNGKASKVEITTGALELAFPPDAEGEFEVGVDASNTYIFLHDEIPGF